LVIYLNWVVSVFAGQETMPFGGGGYLFCGTGSNDYSAEQDC